jgi:hypothetical protein
MERRVGMLFATVLITVLPGACSTHTSLEDDKRAAIAVVLAHELACQTYDFDKWIPCTPRIHRESRSLIRSPRNPACAKTIKSSRTRLSASTIVPRMRWPKCKAMLHGSR